MKGQRDSASEFKKRSVVDTDIIIDLLRGVSKSNDFFEQLFEGNNEAYYSAITEVELFSGKECEKSEHRALIQDLLKQMICVSVTREIAQKAGEIRRKHSLTLPDAIIAATAVSLRVKELTTRNKKHFSIVKELKVKVPY